MRDAPVEPVSALPLPRSKAGTFLVGMVLVDLPVLLVVGAFGWVYGFERTYEAVAAWRAAHLWSFLPSAALAVLFVRRMFR